ncbi:MAG: sodium-translocating pyrophosphatase, partial [Gemmatimonadetes bacterium]|nr:sodium-translocating pyrophosphatase [Gemmatimonadota bacterium]
MRSWLAHDLMARVTSARRFRVLAALAALFVIALPLAAQGPVEHKPGGEANLVLPDMTSVTFIGGLNGYSLLALGLLFCAAGLLFGLMIYTQLRNLPVHKAMRDISELIYETCKTYLVTQGKFILIL